MGKCFFCDADSEISIFGDNSTLYHCPVCGNYILDLETQGALFRATLNEDCHSLVEQSLKEILAENKQQNKTIKISISFVN